MNNYKWDLRYKNHGDPVFVYLKHILLKLTILLANPFSGVWESLESEKLIN